MSGGSLDYFYSTLEEHVGDFDDAELDDLVRDLANLFHDREWFLSSDTSEGSWNEARDAFKKKWFTECGRRDRIAGYLDDVRDKVFKSLGMFEGYCKNCRNWKPKPDSEYGNCAYEKHCLMHRSETCGKFAPKGEQGEANE